MILKAADWRFRVDVAKTREMTESYSRDHCTCGYCQNYYDTVERTYPGLKLFLGEFGIHIHGPIEVMPFEPTLVLACYRVWGKILQWGHTPLYVDGIPIVPEAADADMFLLWVGEMTLPWVQQEKAEDVVSPANLPEFLERMRYAWVLRHGDEIVFS